MIEPATRPPSHAPLARRLAAVAALVRPGAAVADVGADHGMLGAALLLDGRATRVIAMDLREAPLRGAAARARRLGLEAEGRFEARRSDGLIALRPGEAQTVVIAGMGGGLIRRILERATVLTGPGAPARLVLQPNLDAWRVRDWAAQRGWGAVDERLVLDGGRYYPVLALERAEAPPCWDAADLRWGPIIRVRQPAELDAMLAEEEARLAALVARLPASQTAALRAALDPLRAERARLARALAPPPR